MSVPSGVFAIISVDGVIYLYPHIGIPVTFISWKVLSSLPAAVLNDPVRLIVNDLSARFLVKGTTVSAPGIIYY